VAPPEAWCVLQVSSRQSGGGEAAIAEALARGLRERGQRCWRAVGAAGRPDPWTRELPPPASRWSRWWSSRTPPPESVGGARARRLACLTLAHPLKAWDRWRGREDFRFPSTAGLLALAPEPPSLLHLHNLHGGYFDLRALPSLSRAVPTFMTLHDAWLLSGHCAHSFGCERWRSGCGACPDLRIPPEVMRDATAANWRRKRAIMERSRLRVAAPSRWLMAKAEASLMAPALFETRVIPNGVDLELFAPGDRAQARAALGVAPEAQLLAFAAHSIHGNRWKDFPLLRDAVGRLGAEAGPPLVLLAAGDAGQPERSGRAEIRFIPFCDDPAAIARLLLAADVYAHPARADTYPGAVIEALACGTPVVATAVGGIPEQVEDGVTGLLTPAGDVGAFTAALRRLLGDAALRSACSTAALARRGRFDQRTMVDRYLDWYRETLEREVHDG
jgi:glycosyltransferase involved in cell wall biosynthesis